MKFTKLAIAVFLVVAANSTFAGDSWDRDTPRGEGRLSFVLEAEPLPPGVSGLDTSKACAALPHPIITSIGDSTCGGRTLDNSPELKWTDVNGNTGYYWQIRTFSGFLVVDGIEHTNVTSVQLGHLDSGDYRARVKAFGDGDFFCNSDWSKTCLFSVGYVEGNEIDFTWWPEEPKAGESVRFADLTTGAPTSWHWDFGDGSTSSQQHPAHVFASTGDFTVQRRVEFASGAVLESDTITVTGTVECGNELCENGETAWSCQTDCGLNAGETGRAGGSGRRLTVPAAAAGLQGGRRHRMDDRKGGSTIPVKKPHPSSSSTPNATKRLCIRPAHLTSFQVRRFIGRTLLRTCSAAAAAVDCGSTRQHRCSSRPAPTLKILQKATIPMPAPLGRAIQAPAKAWHWLPATEWPI